MSYNILADDYAHQHAEELYSSVPAAALDWGSRASLIAREVVHWAPDVVCFQEVDRYDDLEALLRPHGFAGMFTRRTGGRRDGLATFWREGRWRAEALRPLEFAQRDLKDNVCQLTILRHSPGEEGGDARRPSSLSRPRASLSSLSSSLLVANIHVLFNPKRGDIKLAQVRTMLEEAARLASELKAGHTHPPSTTQRPPVSPAHRIQNKPPIVVCGDFNSAAESPLYEFIVRGELDLTGTDRTRLSGQVEVAGRTGWGAIRFSFMQALRSGYGEGEAMRMACGLGGGVGSRGAANAFTAPSPHSVNWHTPHASLPNDDMSIDPSEASSVSASVFSEPPPPGRSPKPPRAWKPEELAIAIGSSTESDGDCGMPSVGPLIARHPLTLASAYAAVTGSEPLYTTAHDRYVGTVDYIFYEPDRLRPRRVVQPPPLRTLYSGLPNALWPSDHTSIIADFDLTF